MFALCSCISILDEGRYNLEVYLNEMALKRKGIGDFRAFCDRDSSRVRRWTISERFL